MARVILDISVSLDGFVAGPNATLEEPLGEGGERLHDWIVPTKVWREMHGMQGGETGPENEFLEGRLGLAGATVMGRRMFSGGFGPGPWEEDPNAEGWWGDEPPFHHPVFVVTHHGREPLELKGTTFTFVTDGVESAIEQSRAVAGDKDVSIGGGAEVAQQALRAGLVDEISLHMAPVFLGGGARLFEDVGSDLRLEKTDVRDSPATTHIRFGVRN